MKRGVFFNTLIIQLIFGMTSSCPMPASGFRVSSLSNNRLQPKTNYPVLVIPSAVEESSEDKLSLPKREFSFFHALFAR